MTTATLQHKVQRTRFAQHVWAAIASAVPTGWLSRAVAPARKLSPAEAASREAQEVRSMAHAYSRTDPGFAADLYAAAARHEGLHSR